jgi:hypothetical protein
MAESSRLAYCPGRCGNWGHLVCGQYSFGFHGSYSIVPFIHEGLLFSNWDSVFIHTDYERRNGIYGKNRFGNTGSLTKLPDAFQVAGQGAVNFSEAPLLGIPR